MAAAMHRLEQEHAQEVPRDVQGAYLLVQKPVQLGMVELFAFSKGKPGW